MEKARYGEDRSWWSAYTLATSGIQHTVQWRGCDDEETCCIAVYQLFSMLGDGQICLGGLYNSLTYTATALFPILFDWVCTSETLILNDFVVSCLYALTPRLRVIRNLLLCFVLAELNLQRVRDQHESVPWQTFTCQHPPVRIRDTS